MVEACKKKRIVISCLIIVVLAFVKVMIWGFGDLDELWNYNMSRGIVMGLVPYRDFNMVLTPLFAFFNSLAVLFSRSLIAYRVSCSVILSVFMLLVFKAISQKTNRYYALPSVLLCLLFSSVVTYNTFFMIFVLTIYLLFQRKDSNTRNILIGISGACAALSRQTSGGILILIVLILLAGPWGGGTSKKQRFKDVSFCILGGLVPCVAFLIYLLSTNAFGAFWDYCFFGLFAFGNGNGIFQISALPYLFIALLGIICDIALLKTDRKAAITHLMLGITVFIIAIPIVENVHTSFAAIWFLIPVVIFIKKRFGRNLSKRLSVILISVLAVVVALMSVLGVIGCNVIETPVELKGIFADRTLVSDYIALADQSEKYEEQGYRVITISNSAVLISIVKGDIDPVFDMFNKGNFGVNDPMKYVEEVCNNENSLIQMPDDYATEGWQNPDGVYEYVVSHCEEIDNYGRFKLYKPL